MGLSQELEFDTPVLLSSGDQILVSLFDYTDTNDVIDADAEAEVIEFLCDEGAPLSKGDLIRLKDSEYQVDQCLKTGIGLKEVRLKCVKEQRSGMSFGRL